MPPLMVESVSLVTHIVQQGARIGDTSQNPCNCEANLCKGCPISPCRSDIAVVPYVEYLCICVYVRTFATDWMMRNEGR